MRPRRGDLPLRAALVALGTSVLILGWAARSALVIEAVPANAAAAVPLELVPLAEASAPGRDYLAVAVASAPFNPARQPPRQRLPMPGEAALVPAIVPGGQAVTVTPQQAASSVRLIGTMLLPEGGGVALVQWAGEAARLVRPGEAVAELTLRTVRKGSAVFSTPDGSHIEIDVQKTGS